VAIPKLRGHVRILHLSDLHASSVVPLSLLSAAIDRGIQARPDLICLTGDFITDAEPIDWAGYSSLLSRLSKTAPTFATLGNHDGGVWAAGREGLRDASSVMMLLSDAHIPLLHNSSRVLEFRDSLLRLSGVGDMWSMEVDADSALPEQLVGIPTVLMAHNPDTKDLVDSRPWDLMLSGHTHGGQVLVPVLGDRYAPVRDKRFISGLKQWEGRQIYITRGVGSLAGVRFNCRPEITVLDLHA
jgi:predicted MPP superfamily phosphohydrolase